MKQNLTDITVVLDRSGSMTKIRSDMEGGFNQFVKDQRVMPGECQLTLVQFDLNLGHVCVDRVYEALPITEVPLMQLLPRGSTPLHDAIGQTIVTTGERLNKIPEAERPGKVVFMIITDGLENASREYTKDRIKQMIEQQNSTYKWEFVFLGANMDAVSEAAQLGIMREQAATYDHTQKGATAMYASASASIGRLRSHGPKAMSFTDNERKNMKE